MKKLIKYLKVDKFSELYGIPFGIIVGIIIGKTYNIYVGILSFILISIVLGNIFRTLWYFRYAKKFNEYHDKNIMVKPEKAMEFYIENLTQQKAIRNTAINDYYYDRIKELNYFDEIEKVILSYMSNDESMELANNSKDWYEKLYYYGFIKSNSKDGD